MRSFFNKALVVTIILTLQALTLLTTDICGQLQRNLKFDLHKAEFVGDPEANRMRSRAMRPPYMI